MERKPKEIFDYGGELLGVLGVKQKSEPTVYIGVSLIFVFVVK